MRVASSFFRILLVFGLSVPASAFESTVPPPVIKAADTGLTVPDTVDAAQRVTAIVSSQAGGVIEIWGPISQSGRGGRIGRVPISGGSAALRAPADSGSYEVRHVTPNGRVVARAPLDVVAAPVSLQVPESVGIGGVVTITWLGPADPGDRLQIVDPRTGSVHGQIEAAGAGSRSTQATMRAPSVPGPYELRYVNARDAVLRHVTFEVASGGGWLRTPLSVKAGSRFELEWFGGLPPGFVFRIVTSESRATVTEAPVEIGAGNRANGFITAPDYPGKYMIQLANPNSNNVVTSLPLTVE